MSHFKDSVEATEFMDRLDSMLRDSRLSAWCKSTDENFNVQTTVKLEEARDAYKDLMERMESAC